MNYKSMWRQLKENLELPYSQKRGFITIGEVLLYMHQIEEKERWNIEHKKGPPPRCPPTPY